MSEDHEQEVQTIKVHIPPDLEYSYRDIANIFVGDNEVVFEFGNRHRSTPDQATISNRIVLSIAAAFDLQQRLQASLKEAQLKLQESLNL